MSDQLKSSIEVSSCSSIPELQGYLSITLGPMMSGKTLAVVLKGTEEAQFGYKVLYINHSDDVRVTAGGDGKGFSSHCESLKTMTDKIDVVSVSKLSDVNVDDYAVICIDEGQFFSDIVECVLDWVNNKRKHVHIAALDGTFEKKLFGNVYKLLPEADYFVKKSAQCKYCMEELHLNGHKRPVIGLPAPFTMRLGSCKSEKEIGGQDKYASVCRLHHKIQI